MTCQLIGFRFAHSSDDKEPGYFKKSSYEAWATEINCKGTNYTRAGFNVDFSFDFPKDDKVIIRLKPELKNRGQESEDIRIEAQLSRKENRIHAPGFEVEFKKWIMDKTWSVADLKMSKPFQQTARVQCSGHTPGQ